jgi:hypothetical protein
MAYTLREVAVRPRGHDLVVFVRGHHSANITPAGAAHRLFRITLSDGSHYAVNFTNAQFSQLPARMHFHGIIPWDDYLTHLQLVEADMSVTHEPPDQNFMPRMGPLSKENTRKLAGSLRKDRHFDVKKRRKMTALLTQFSLLISIQNCLIKGFHKKGKPTIYLTEILTGPKARCADYARRILSDLRICLLAWRLVLGFGERLATWDDGRETPTDFLQVMWNLLTAALKEIPGQVTRFERKRNKLFVDVISVDTPQQSA